MQRACEAAPIFAPIPDGGRNYVLALEGLFLLGLLLSLLWPWERWKMHLCPYFWYYILWAAVVLLAGFSFYIFGRRYPWNLLTLLYPLFYVMIVFFAEWVYDWKHTPSQSIFTYRYIHVLSGASPIFPWLLLFAAGSWWAWYSLSGLVLVDQRRPRLPATLGRLRLFQLSEDGNCRLIQVVGIGRNNRVHIPILFVVFLTLPVIDHRHPLRSLEGKPFDQLYSFALALAIFELLCTLLRLVFTWLECRRMLLTLDGLLLRRGFVPLEGFSWKPIWRLRGGLLQDSLRMAARQVQSLRNLQNLIKGREDNLHVNIRQAINQQEKVISRLQDAPCDPDDEFRAIARAQLVRSSPDNLP